MHRAVMRESCLNALRILWRRTGQQDQFIACALPPGNFVWFIYERNLYPKQNIFRRNSRNQGGLSKLSKDQGELRTIKLSQGKYDFASRMCVFRSEAAWRPFARTHCTDILFLSQTIVTTQKLVREEAGPRPRLAPRRCQICLGAENCAKTRCVCLGPSALTKSLFCPKLLVDPRVFLKQTIVNTHACACMHD